MNATCSSVSELRDSIVRGGAVKAAYLAKMAHAVPDWPTVANRGHYLVTKAIGKVVLDIGCTGAISANVKAVAKQYYGVDKEGGDWYVVDLDRDPDQIPHVADVELVYVSECLEHLSNPGRFLDALRAAYPTTDTYITVPNAGAYQVHGGCEMVHGDHVAWYSYTTLLRLLTRHGYALQECRWYHGQPHTAEGLIMRVRGTP